MGSMVRWGILSTARIGRALVKGIGLSKTSCVQAVASRDRTRANEWAKEHGIPRAFGSYEELIDSGEIDALYNPLPNNMHAEWTIRALEAGLPVLCEKPLTVNAAQARQVADAAARTGVLVAEAFMYRFHPVYDRVVESVERGDIGDVVMVRSAFSFNLRDRTNIRWSRELAGGALMDVGCYCVNLSRRFAGCEPSEVRAMERVDGVDGTLLGMLDFPNGVMAMFETSMERQSRAFAEIEGTDGTITLKAPWFPGEERGEYTLRRGDDEETVATAGANSYQLEVDDFARALRSGTAPRWALDDAVANMAVIDALYRAAREGVASSVESV